MELWRTGDPLIETVENRGLMDQTAEKRGPMDQTGEKRIQMDRAVDNKGSVDRNSEQTEGPMDRVENERRD